MKPSDLLPDLIARSAERDPGARALTCGAESLEYARLDESVRAFASALGALGLARAERVGIYLEKRFETVVASFGAPAAGGYSSRSTRCSSPSRSATSCATATCACW